MCQLEFELYSNETETKVEKEMAELRFNLEIIEKKYDTLRKSFFSRFHNLENMFQENLKEISLLKRENEALKINLLVGNGKF